ncbi:CBS domain-containing protein [Saccharopolyspora sp. NPDC000359]|uniref:CBS domain-containing protein n=1 Tax=Saccharopolyspora sp. NPDC000359 TaxID=3154251 RepID=UPI003325AB00
MTTARDIMHSGAKCINEDDSLYTAAQMMRDLKVGSLPICGRDNRLHGIITDRDIVVRCCAEGRDPSEMKAGELAQGKPYWVDAGSDVTKVLSMMEEHQIRRIPVIAEHQLVGMISEADLARHLTDEQLAHFVESVYASK